MYRISYDGEDWFEIDNVEMQKMLDDSFSPDCWIDLSVGAMVHHCTLNRLRNVRAELESVAAVWVMPETLFGLPVVYEGRK